MKPFIPVSSFRLLALAAIPAGLCAQSADPVPRPRQTLPVEAPVAPPAPVAEILPPIFTPGFVPSLNSSSAGSSDPNLIVMAAVRVKDTILWSPSSPSVPTETPAQRFLRTGLLYEQVGKTITIEVKPTGFGIFW